VGLDIRRVDVTGIKISQWQQHELLAQLGIEVIE